MLCSHKEILYSHGNAFSRAMDNNVNESHKYDFEEKKAKYKQYKLYDSFYAK